MKCGVIIWDFYGGSVVVLIFSALSIYRVSRGGFSLYDISQIKQTKQKKLRARGKVNHRFYVDTLISIEFVDAKK